jgi:hypothetical protein
MESVGRPLRTVRRARTTEGASEPHTASAASYPRLQKAQGRAPPVNVVATSAEGWATGRCCKTGHHELRCDTFYPLKARDVSAVSHGAHQGRWFPAFENRESWGNLSRVRWARCTKPKLGRLPTHQSCAATHAHTCPRLIQVHVGRPFNSYGLPPMKPFSCKRENTTAVAL